MRELDAIRASQGGCPTGSAVATGAGALAAKHVLHAVGPIYRDGRQGEPEQLASCYRTCLELAERLGVASISFPAISTGIYGYPVEEAAGIAVQAVAEHLRKPGSCVREVLLVLFDQVSYAVYERAASGV